ncbi:hypothetical protein F4782DRAFT_532549 [Xylaria castorea]|nr:hypothetical protein F4782DRAFT_532549 [Xylaria castorea]
MADTQVLARPTSTWTSFANTTTTVPISSTALSTTSGASSSSFITFLPTLTISTTFPPPTSSSSAVSSFSLSSPSSSTSNLSTTSSLGVPTVAFSSLSTGSPLTETVSDPPFIPIPISSSSLPTSSVTSATIPDISISQPTSNLPSSPSPATTLIITYPTPADVSSPLSSLTLSNPNIPTPNPTSGFAPPPAGDQRTPPILMIIAIVISIFIFILLVTLLVLRQLALRQHAQRFRDIDLPPTGSSSHSTASTTYHSAHRGEVRVVIERPPGMSGEERLWPVPPGHPSHYYAEPGMAAEGEESGAADPNQWSVTSQDGSNNLSETGAGMGRGRASARAGVERAC